MKIKLLGALSMLAVLSTNAFAYNEHSDWSWSRGSSYQGSFQYITETQAINATTTSITKTTNDLGDETVQQKSQSFRGSAIKIATGIELARFARFEVFSSHKDLTENLNSSLRGVEAGGAANISFYGPVVNIQFGLGILGSRLHKQDKEEGTIYYGTGFFGSVGLERFIAQKASVIFSVKGSEQTLSPEKQNSETKLNFKELSAGLALVLWI